MKPYLILLQYNGWNETTIIHHMNEKSALYRAWQLYKPKGLVNCRVVR